MRTQKEEYFLDLALRCARQGTCLRRNFGAIIVDAHKTIVASGYSGSPAGTPHCKTCWREDNNIESGSNYEKCRSVHAEQNALLQAGKSARGCDLYLAGYDVKSGEVVAGKPCYICTKMIVNAGINKIIVYDPKSILNYVVYIPEELFKIYDKQIFTLNAGSGYK